MKKYFECYFITNRSPCFSFSGKIQEEILEIMKDKIKDIDENIFDN